MGNQLPPWDARVRLHQEREAATAAAKPPRALDPATDRPFNRPTVKQKLTFAAMDRLPAFVSSWITRYLLTALTAFGTIWGATKEETAGAAAYLGGLIIFLLLAGLRWIKNRILSKGGTPVINPTKVLLLALCFTSLTLFPSCRAVGRGLTTAGATVVSVGMKPDDWGSNLKSPVARVAVAPFTLTICAASAVIGVPLFLAGAAMGGIN